MINGNEIYLVNAGSYEDQYIVSAHRTLERAELTAGRINFNMSDTYDSASVEELFINEDTDELPVDSEVIEAFLLKVRDWQPSSSHRYIMTVPLKFEYRIVKKKDKEDFYVFGRTEEVVYKVVKDILDRRNFASIVEDELKLSDK